MAMMLEYCVSSYGRDKVFASWDKAAAHAFTLAATGNGDVMLDVVIGDEEGARSYGGEDAVERYLDDPDASVFERFEIRVNCVGMVS